MIFVAPAQVLEVKHAIDPRIYRQRVGLGMALADHEIGSDSTSHVATLVAMTASPEHMPLADVKNRLSEVVERLEREHGRVVITKHGRPAAVVLNVADLEGLEQTLELLSNPRAMRRIRRAEAEIAAGEAAELTKDEALALVRR